jgi:hypothetical protein
MERMALRRHIVTLTNIVTEHRFSPFRPGAFRSAVHQPRTAVIIGRWLGSAIIICFTTGLLSHYLQEPVSWMSFPTRPIWWYRLTQGTHVATGIAAIPLLLAKLWTVYPNLFQWPPIRSVAHAAERASIAVFVSATLTQLVIGLFNTIGWYAWKFPFRQTHFWLAWIIVGSLLVHIAAKLPTIRENWWQVPFVAAQQRGWSRRTFLGAVTAAVAAAAVTTVGQSFTPLKRLDLLAPRKPHVGPQGLPINKTAAQAGVTESAFSPDWRLQLVNGPRTTTLTLAELNALPQHTVELPISCVEGWSQNATWSGVRIRDLLELISAPASSTLHVVSLQRRGLYRQSEMGPEYARDERTLLALRLGGEVLHVEHGFPARVIAPARPGVLQTKWVTRLEVLR